MIKVNAEIQISWFCPECGKHLIVILDDLKDTQQVVNKAHDRELGYRPCPVEWFSVRFQYPEVTVELYSN